MCSFSGVHDDVLAQIRFSAEAAAAVLAWKSQQRQILLHPQSLIKTLALWQHTSSQSSNKNNFNGTTV